MNEKLDAIWRTLQKDDLPSTCRACEDGLYAYAEAVLDNADADARFPSMRPHLDECPTCQTALAEMLALLEMERSGQMQEPPVSARYDFSYLPVAPAPTEPAPRFWRFDELGRLIIQFSAELLQSWQPPALQPAYLKSGQPESLFEAEIGEDLDDLSVAVSVKSQRQEPDLLEISVGVDVPSRGGWPNLGGIEVLLKNDAITVGREWTDAFGQIVFAHVPRADVNDLAFIIIPPDSN